MLLRKIKTSKLIHRAAYTSKTNDEKLQRCRFLAPDSTMQRHIV
jgi:hypothetical protein